jgi:hypothetical protein
MNYNGKILILNYNELLQKKISDEDNAREEIMNKMRNALNPTTDITANEFMYKNDDINDYVDEVPNTHNNKCIEGDDDIILSKQLNEMRLQSENMLNNENNTYDRYQNILKKQIKNLPDGNEPIWMHIKSEVDMCEKYHNEQKNETECVEPVDEPNDTEYIKMLDDEEIIRKNILDDMKKHISDDHAILDMGMNTNIDINALIELKHNFFTRDRYYWSNKENKIYCRCPDMQFTDCIENETLVELIKYNNLFEIKFDDNDL